MVLILACIYVKFERLIIDSFPTMDLNPNLQLTLKLDSALTMDRPKHKSVFDHETRNVDRHISLDSYRDVTII